MKGVRRLLLFFFILKIGPGASICLVSASQGKPLGLQHPPWDSEATGVKLNASNVARVTEGKERAG